MRVRLMGSLLSMGLADYNSLKLTKSICTCQGKNPLVLLTSDLSGSF
jgi:hypothetical protein